MCVCGGGGERSCISVCVEEGEGGVEVIKSRSIKTSNIKSYGPLSERSSDVNALQQ